MKRCGFLLLPPDTLRPDVGAENLGRSCAGRLGDRSEMMKRCGFLLLPPDTLRPDVGAENLGRSCAGRLGDEAILYEPTGCPARPSFGLGHGSWA